MLQCTTHRSSLARNLCGGRASVARAASAVALAGLASLASAAEIETVAPGVYALIGHGGVIDAGNEGRVANVAFVVGRSGVVVVDSGASARQGEDIIEAVARVTRQPIRLLVLTHAGQEVVFGAAAFQARGIPVLMHRDAGALMASRCEGCLRALRDTLGEQTMQGTRIVTPDRLVDASQRLDVIGRRLRLVVPRGPSGTGMLALLDEATHTLLTGSLVTIDQVPDLRDAEGIGWRDALASLAATKCRHLVPGFGRPGTCADIEGMDRYFAALDRRVRDVIAAGVGLSEASARSDLPQFAGWGGYAALHAQNVNRAYVTLERELFVN
jgi:glyoxylase-like metal-dependent hydrolase (beta-lactamase superfamily II)